MMNIDQNQNQINQIDQSSPTAELERLMREQNQLLRELTSLKKSQKNRQTRTDLYGLIKWVVIVGGILWTLLEAKMFLTGLFESLTPDFSGLTQKGSELTEGSQDALENILKRAESLFNN